MRRFRRLGIFTSLNTLIQVIAFVAGIVAVRSMDKSEFAIYTIALGIAAGTAVIAGSGISSVLIARGGAATSSGGSLAYTLAGAISARRRLLLWVIGPVLVLLLVLLVRAGAPPWQAALIAVLVLVNVLVTIDTSLSEAALLLFRDLRTVQVTALLSNLARLAAFAVLGILTMGIAAYFLIAASAAVWLQSIAMRRGIRRRTVVPKTITREMTAPYREAIRRTLAASVFQIVGEQSVTATLTLLGNLTAVADIAALSRFGVALIIVNAIVAQMAVPAIATRMHTRREIAAVSVRLVSVYLLLVILMVIGSWIAADLLLWLLGPQYSGLQVELVIMVAGVAIGSFSINTIGAINYARGWQRLSWTYIPLLVVWYGLCFWLLDLSTTMGAIVFAATFSIPVFVNQTIRFIVGYRAMDA